jgi:hypothetical protein
MSLFPEAQTDCLERAEKRDCILARVYCTSTTQAQQQRPSNTNHGSAAVLVLQLVALLLVLLQLLVPGERPGVRAAWTIEQTAANAAVLKTPY